MLVSFGVIFGAMYYQSTLPKPAYASLSFLLTAFVYFCFCFLLQCFSRFSIAIHHISTSSSLSLLPLLLSTCPQRAISLSEVTISANRTSVDSTVVYCYCQSIGLTEAINVRALVVTLFFDVGSLNSFLRVTLSS
jgi:hypothetical protein